jgi:hypothetical protein
VREQRVPAPRGGKEVILYSVGRPLE